MQQSCDEARQKAAYPEYDEDGKLREKTEEPIDFCRHEMLPSSRNCSHAQEHAVCWKTGRP
jgi:hypothetical protein